MQNKLLGEKKLPKVKYGLFKSHIGTWDGSCTDRGPTFQVNVWGNGDGLLNVLGRICGVSFVKGFHLLWCWEGFPF